MVVGVVALTVLLVAGGLSLRKPPAFTPPAAASEAPAATTAPAPPTSITLPADPQMLVFGDSYTEGNGADGPDSTFARVAAGQLDWPVETDGKGGTGYLNRGPNGEESFAQRIQNLETSSPPNIVLIQGGLNDAPESGDLTVAAQEVIGLMRARFPEAQVILLGPVDPAPPYPNLARVVEALRTAAANEQVPFIDASGWITPEGVEQYSAGDGLHVNQAGHDYIGTRLAEALGKLAAGP